MLRLLARNLGVSLWSCVPFLLHFMLVLLESRMVSCAIQKTNRALKLQSEFYIRAWNWENVEKYKY